VATVGCALCPTTAGPDSTFAGRLGAGKPVVEVEVEISSVAVPGAGIGYRLEEVEPETVVVIEVSEASADAHAPKTTSARRIEQARSTRLTRTPRRCTDV
jgi:hypothetical protein